MNDSDEFYERREQERYDKIHAAILATGQTRHEVSYGTGGKLDEVAFHGTFVVRAEYDPFWDGLGIGIIGMDPEDQGGGEPCGRHYQSQPITDPTWLQLAVFANEAIIVTNDLHHVFFEGARVEENGLVIDLQFGS